MVSRENCVAHRVGETSHWVAGAETLCEECKVRRRYTGGLPPLPVPAVLLLKENMLQVVDAGKRQEGKA